MINNTAVGQPRPGPGSASGSVSGPVVDRLTDVLFGTDFHREHEPWRRIAAAESFRQMAVAAPGGPGAAGGLGAPGAPGAPGASPQERLSRAYARLRTVNATLDSPAALAADPRRLAALHEWLGPVDPTFTTVAGIHYNLFLGSLLDHDGGAADAGGGVGGDARGEAAGEAAGDAPGGRDLTDFLTLRRVGTFLCTEVAHGNDAAAVETTATYDRARAGFVLHTPHAGAQKFMPNTSPTGGPKSGVVAARLLVDGTDHGVFLFLAPLTDAVRALPGVRVRRLPPRTGSPVDHCLTSFDQVFVGRDALLGGAQGRLGADGGFSSAQRNRRRRFLASIGRVTPGKLSMSAGAVGSARTTLALAVRYGGNRLISGSRAADRVPVIAHRTHHGPLVEALATVFAMTLLHRTALAAWESHTEKTKAEAERLVAVAKGWITWQARDVILECRERCGAQGLLDNNGMTELMAGIEGAITAEGDNVAIYTKAAAEMLFAGGGAGGAGADPVARTRSGDLGDLCDHGATSRLTELCGDIEEMWLSRARTRMSGVPHGDPLARWNAASGAALRAVEAHAYRRAAEAFATAADTLAPGTEAYGLLRALQRLFVLRWIDRNSGDLLARGRLSAHHIDQLPHAMEQLIAELAGSAPTLVASFALPEELLADHPIGRAHYTGAYDDPAAPWHTEPANEPAHELAHKAATEPADEPADEPAHELAHKAATEPDHKLFAELSAQPSAPPSLQRTR